MHRNNSNNLIRQYLENKLNKRISDSYWYRIKKWLYFNSCYSSEGIDRYLNRFSISPIELENTTKWLEKAPDNIKFTDFLPTVEKVFNIKWVKKPDRTTVYKWFNSSEIDFRELGLNAKCRKYNTYSKTTLIPVVNKVIYSRLVLSIN